jgi:predicted nucleic acid-binding protein
MINEFPDTSFLCSLFYRRAFTPAAIAYMGGLGRPLTVSSLLLLEFRQSVRFQMRLHSMDRGKGYSPAEGTRMLRDLQSDLAGGVLEIVTVDWADVHRIAEELSAMHTARNGNRLADILHVATALHLASPVFLTFDEQQRKLAEAEGMTVPV